MTGAKWFKFDFHTHTPASHDFGKGENYESQQQISPREWLLNFMKEEIDCVAVTDHNSGEWVDKLKKELLKMEEEKCVGFRPLTIFPGVEISVNGNLHVLALFSPNKGGEEITKLLGNVEYNGDHGQTDGSTIKSFVQVVEAIHKSSGIAIPAHVDDHKGLLFECQGKALEVNLGAPGLMALEFKNKDYDKPKVYTDKKFNFTEVIGSDCHHSDSVGEKFTWVKMEKPSIDALRLALHDGEDGVIRFDNYTGNPNELNDKFYIKSINIKDGAKAGRGEELVFNFSPWMTTIIGGRGSGKSSLLEYARFPLNITKNLPNDIQERFNKFSQVYSKGKTGMLTDTTRIRIELRKDGREIALTWKENEVIEEQYIDGDWVKSSDSIVDNSRFPVRIFSQKQLYEMTEDPKTVMSLIDNKFDKIEWERKKEELLLDFFESRRKERELRSKINNKPYFSSKVKDIEAKLKIYQQKGHFQLLKDYEEVNNTSEEVINICKGINEYNDNLINKIKKESPSISESLVNTLDDQSMGLITQYINNFEKTQEHLIDVLMGLKQGHNEFKRDFKETSFNKRRKRINSDYKEFINELTAAGVKNPGEYKELVREKYIADRELTKIEGYEKELDEQMENCKNAYVLVQEHERELREQRQQIVDKWNAENEDIVVLIEEFGDMETAEKTFRRIIRKEDEKSYSKAICERDDEGIVRSGLIYDIVTADTQERWNIRNEKIKMITTNNEERDKKIGKPFSKHMKALEDNTPEDIDRLLTWFPEDKVILNLKVNGKKENIENGSAGERTAAMLSLLLSLDDSPIIIDQPEDDLDTSKISSLVVESLRKLKNKQQVIVITHNPNIPVNGGAEQIIHMSYIKGAIRVRNQGALQNQHIREAVCDVMEGGSKALDNRYYRISKALENQNTR